MEKVTFDYGKSAGFISQEEISYMTKLVEDAKDLLVSKKGAGNDFLGWLDLPVDYDKEEFERIKKASAKSVANLRHLVNHSGACLINVSDETTFENASIYAIPENIPVILR